VENAALRSVITAVFDLGPHARRLLGLLIAEIDRPAPMIETRKDIPSPRPLPATIERRQRRQRAQQRQAAKAANKAVEANDWGQLRQQLRTIIRERRLTHAEVGAALAAKPGTVATWLARSHADRAPGERAQARIRQWLRDGAVVSAAVVPLPNRLNEDEQARLRGHLALQDGRELQVQFGANKSVLEEAAAGAHLNAEVVSRVRAVLTGNGAAAE
jgi:hypothetical protein